MHGFIEAVRLLAGRDQDQLRSGPARRCERSTRSNRRGFVQQPAAQIGSARPKGGGEPPVLGCTWSMAPGLVELVDACAEALTGTIAVAGLKSVRLGRRLRDLQCVLKGSFASPGFPSTFNLLFYVLA